MEPGYNDPNYWTRWYAELQELQRAQQESENAPADQARFEQQVSESERDSSEESSAELSSPDTRASEAPENIRRTDVGGSMGMPPRPNLRDNSFSGTRYSVHVPRGYFGSDADDLRSDLGGEPISSMRYTAEAQPTAHTKDRKSDGLLSRVKSGLGKVFGGSRGERSLSGSRPDAAKSELRIYAYKRSRASEEDKVLISEFARGATGSYASSSLQKMGEHLSRFSEFLNSQNLTLAGLVESPEQLKAHADEFVNAGGIKRVYAALEALRKFRAGELAPPLPAPPPRAQPPAPTGDALLIHQFAAAARAHEVPNETFRSHTEILNSFSKWLTANQKPPLTSRFRSEEIAEDIMAFGEENDPKGRLFTAINHLRRLQPDGEGFEALGPGPRVMGRRTLSAYESDADMIDEATNEALRKLGPAATAKERAPILRIASNQRKLSEWLKSEGKESIASRIDGSEQQKKELQKDISEFKRAIGQSYIGLDIKKLRHPASDELQHGLQPYDDDRNIIDGLFEEELSRLGSGRTAKTVRNTASGQRKFSDWLRTTGRESIASRINGDWHQRKSLEEDYQEFTRAKGNVGIGFKRLAQYVQMIEANRALGINIPEQAADAISMPTWMRELPAPPSESQWPPLLGPLGETGLQLPAGSSSTWSPHPPSYFDFRILEGEPARSSDVYRGLSSFTDLPSTPGSMRDDAQSRPVLSPAGRPPFFIGPSGAPQELEDIGHLVGDDWQHGSQPVPEFLLDVLDNKMLLPNSQYAPQPVAVHGETYSITLGPRGRRDAQLIHHPGPSSAPDTRIVASTASASAGDHDRSGRVLGARQWLGDEHIHRDYELLSQELQRTNPNLAARTRFVDPLIASMIREGTDDRALREFQRIVYDRNGNDAADFLFLPINDSTAQDQERYLQSLQRNDASVRDRAGVGSHWSFLLVDRRDRDRPVAYHYDSAQGHNARPAAMLAARIGAHLQDAPISQQRNSYDCGVFVVDGTRALVKRLAGRRQADLSLDDLVIDRQALQIRLRG